jgi:steroid 5-alpha reductase family enzyme
MRLNHYPRRLDVTNLRAVAGVSAAAVTLSQAATAVVALRSGRRDYADAVWGPGLAAVSLVSAVVGRGNAWRRWSLAVVSTGWAWLFARCVQKSTTWPELAEVARSVAPA